MRCKMCGRKLTNKQSIASQCGPVCSGRRRPGSWQMELNFHPKIDRAASELEQYRMAIRMIKGE